MVTPRFVLKWLGTAAAVLVGAVLVVIVLTLGINSFGRWQARLDAHNKVTLTKIQIQNQQQYAKVVKAQNQSVRAQAQQRYLDSLGVRAAQDKISKTLTPLYVEYEMTKVLQAIANSGRNNTVVYVPSGNGGVPVITANASQGK